MESLFSNVESACARGLEEVEAQPASSTVIVICGGGPSLSSTLENIRQMKEGGAKVWGLNGAARYLEKQGIHCDAHVMIDSREKNVDFVQERWADRIYLSSQCHPAVFDECERVGYPVSIWHPIVEGIEKHIPHKSPLLVGGGLTVGLSGMCLAYTLGYREMHLFGFDSSHAEKAGHAYSQPMNDSEELTEVVVGDRVFTCSVTMAAQAASFQKVSEMLADYGCDIFVHGDGLIPHIFRNMTREERILTAVYDLMVSPPTFDFVSFLLEAERARREGGFARVDVVFQPGPMNGFRYDKLPPDQATREGMLHRVCVSLCRCLPSVRNVRVLKAREHIQGEVFPVGYHVEDNPKNHYGTWCFKHSISAFKATESAKRLAAAYGKYITITLRQSKAWNERNSSVGEWVKVAEWLQTAGYRVVFIPGEFGEGPAGFTSCDSALLDVDLRIALYEGAMLNLGSNSGPFAVLFGMEAPYLLFKPCVKGSVLAGDEFLAKNGFTDGDQFSENGKTVWADDDAETIIREVNAFLQTQPLEEK